MPTVPTETPEILIRGHRGMAALRAEKPASGFLQHKPEVIAQDTIRAVFALRNFASLIA
jgi:hypothetical protein